MKPVLWAWGPLTLYSYGLMMAVGFLLFLAYVRRAAAVRRLDPETVTNTAFAALVGGIVGARVFFVVSELGYFSAHPAEILLLNRGGLVWYGGFAGGVAAAWLHTRHRKIDTAQVFDIFIPPLALAQAVGRIGCFMNGCCYGFETKGPWGVCLPDGLGCYFPVQLLNAALLVGLFFGLHHALARAARPGGMIWVYGVGYGALRFTTEFFRGDQTAVLGKLSLPQVISAILFVVSAAALWIRHRHYEKKSAKI